MVTGKPCDGVELEGIRPLSLGLQYVSLNQLRFIESLPGAQMLLQLSFNSREGEGNQAQGGGGLPRVPQLWAVKLGNKHRNNLNRNSFKRELSGWPFLLFSPPCLHPDSFPLLLNNPFLLN